MEIPGGLQVLSAQVAGHTWTDVKALGLLQDAAKGFVFKPLLKPECGEREIRFYETLLSNGKEEEEVEEECSSVENRDKNGPTPTNATIKAITTPFQSGGVVNFSSYRNRLLAIAQHFVPRFYGQVRLNVNGQENVFLQLQDLTAGMAKPCVMDIKIGRQTWDPLADENKRSVEEQKYAGCKQSLGLCVPGFQVYQRTAQQADDDTASSGCRLQRYGKEYGKRLDGRDFPDTMQLFLNATSNAEAPLCHDLVQELLQQLHAIHTWFQAQTFYHFYASSLLLIYDFEMLQRCRGCAAQRRASPCNGHTAASNGNANAMADSSVPAVQPPPPPTRPTTEGNRTKPPPPPPPSSVWVKVRMIDFAHVFPADDQSPDTNYLFGLRSLIDVLEALLPLGGSHKHS